MDFRYIFPLFTTILAGLAYAQFDDLQDMKRSAKKYCGSHLAQALSTVCNGKYNTLQKRDDIYIKRSDYSDPSYPADMPVGNIVFPYQRRSDATSMLSNYRRRRRQSRGVYNECCQKSCSRDELMSYCAPDQIRRKR